MILNKIENNKINPKNVGKIMLNCDIYVIYIHIFILLFLQKTCFVMRARVLLYRKFLSAT